MTHLRILGYATIAAAVVFGLLPLTIYLSNVSSVVANVAAVFALLGGALLAYEGFKLVHRLTTPEEQKE